MNDPWQFLILDRHTATEKDVKAAYARLLKQHRPDKDPEGFQKLRAAYEAALADIARANASPGNAPSYAVSNPSAGEEPDAFQAQDLPLPFHKEMLPAAARELFSELQHAVATENSEQMQAAVTRLEAACRTAGVPALTLVYALQNAFHTDPRRAARGVTEEVLAHLTEQGQVNFCHMVVSVWEDEAIRAPLVNFGKVLLTRRRLLATGEGSALMARVGMLIALEDPHSATALADAAFPHLPVDERAGIIGQMENQIRLGTTFSQVSPDTRAFWIRLLRDPSVTQNWTSGEAQRALQDVVENNRFQWDGWGIVRQLMKPEDWEPVEKRLQAQVKKARQSVPGGSKVSKWATVPAIFIILNLLRMLATDRGSAPHSYGPPYFPPAHSTHGTTAALEQPSPANP